MNNDEHTYNLVFFTEFRVQFSDGSGITWWLVFALSVFMRTVTGTEDIQGGRRPWQCSELCSDSKHWTWLHGRAEDNQWVFWVTFMTLECFLSVQLLNHILVLKHSVRSSSRRTPAVFGPDGYSAIILSGPFLDFCVKLCEICPFSSGFFCVVPIQTKQKKKCV